MSEETRAAGSDFEEGRLSNVTGALLLGGASTRMGQDKAGLQTGGQSWALRLARLLDRLFEECLLVGGDPPPAAPGRRVRDVAGPRCALRGLVSALAESSSERVLVLATDMPLMRADLLLALTAWPEHDAVVPRRASRRHPLCAIYRRERVLARARERLEMGELRLAGLLDALDSGYLEGDSLNVVDPDGSALRNVNTPAERAEVERIWRERASGGLFGIDTFHLPG